MKFTGLDWKDKGYTTRIVNEEGTDLSGSKTKQSSTIVHTTQLLNDSTT